MRVRIVVVEVVHHGIDDVPRGLGPAGAVEIRYRTAAVPTLERREAGANRIHADTLGTRERGGSLHGKAPHVRKRVICKIVGC